MAKLTIVFESLQDLARGVERLRAAAAKAGEQRYSTLCREMNLASDSIDDIPDRTMLRQLLQTLESEVGLDQSRSTQGQGRAGGNAHANGSGELRELRGHRLREAARVSGAMSGTQPPAGRGA